MEENVKSSILSAVGNCVHTSSITKLQTVPLSCLLYTLLKFHGKSLRMQTLYVHANIYMHTDNV